MSSLWQDCLAHLQQQHNITPDEFSIWLRPLQADFTGDSLVLYAQNQFIRDWIEKRYLAFIEQTAIALCGNQNLVVRLEIGIKPSKSYSETENGTIQTAKQREKKGISAVKFRTNLNPKYTFDNFVQGKSNQLARSVAQEIAKMPGDSQRNPFFLYGGTGLGKTHLLHAIGNGILKNRPDAKVLYIRSETFVQDMVKSIRNENSDNFKKHYRSLDTLLIDDIQFFKGKEGSQEEFFHTFNSLLEGGKQIILTSDRYPKEIERIEDRLKSRFNWGLSIPINPPELETRVAILLKKAEENHIHLPEEVAFFIGEKLRTNVRELEGALNKVIADRNLTGSDITIDFVQESLKDMLAVYARSITLDNIQKVVAEYFHIKISDLKSKSRARAVTRPRQIAMALAKELTNRSLPDIGKAFGDRDHTTVLHAYRKILRLKESDNDIQEDYANLIRILSS